MNTALHRYLIVGGAPRSGTTSLYRYLADHPGTCASSVKETRFFLDPDYPLLSTARFNGKNLAEYEKFFAHCPASGSAVRVEASPDYLYSRVALEIASVLPNAKMVFILRDPVQRMVSWYRYAIQRDAISRDVSFEAYVMMQAGRSVKPSTPVHLRALDQCRYAGYLATFRQSMGPRCLVVPFDGLERDPLSVMIDLATAMGLDPTFYRSYEFRRENASHRVRSARVSGAYNTLLRTAVLRLHGNSSVMSILRWPNKVVKKLLALNVARPEEVEVADWLCRLILREAGVLDNPAAGAEKYKDGR